MTSVQLDPEGNDKWQTPIKRLLGSSDKLGSEASECKRYSWDDIVATVAATQSATATVCQATAARKCTKCSVGLRLTHSDDKTKLQERLVVTAVVK